LQAKDLRQNIKAPGDKLLAKDLRQNIKAPGDKLPF
jgi:ribosomal protein L39E